MSDSPSERNPVEALAEEFLERHRRGEQPAVNEYAEKYPDLADEIRDLFPALIMMEAIKPSTSDATGAYDSGPAIAGGKKLERLGDYRILREIGRGGMGIVYEAEQESLGRRVALKVLPTGALLDEQLSKRFEREARAAARLHHTNIVPVFGVGEQDGLHYYVMQYIQGLGLDQVLTELRRLRKSDTTQLSDAKVRAVGSAEWPGKKGIVPLRKGDSPLFSRPLSTPTDPDSLVHVTQSLLTGRFAQPGTLLDSSPGQTGRADTSSVQLPGGSSGAALSETGQHYWQSVARIGVQVADALDYANSQGILHRDIKPSNLLLDTQGTVWVTDFGLAKASGGENLTQTGDIVGTLRYMAPERFQGQSDARGDIYSLGLTLYELVALRSAFHATDRNQLIHEVTHDEPVPPRRINAAIPRDLETIVLKAIEREPGRRYPRAGELAADLRRFLEDKPIQARRVTLRERFWRWCRRNPGLAAATGLAAAALVAVSILSTLVAIQQAHFAEHQGLYNDELLREQQLTQAQKERAEKALQKSADLAGKLAAHLKESQKHTASLALDRGLMLVERQQPYQGLLWLGRGLEQAPPEETDLRLALRLSVAALRREMPVLRTVLQSHDLVYAVAVSPDGKLILTGGGGVGGPRQEARLWDAVKGQPVGPPMVHESTVYAVAFSPDGQTIATASIDGTARLWKTASGEPLSAPLPHQGPVTGVAFSPDGKTLLTGGFGTNQDKGEARLWNVATGKPLGPPTSQPGPVGNVAFSPDGKTFATTIGDYHTFKGEVQLWQTATGQRVGEPLGHPMMVFGLAFSPDGKTLLTGCMDRLARFWDLGTGNQVRQALEHQGYVYAVGYSPDGRTIVTAGDGAVRLWDAESGQPVGAPLPQQGFLHAVPFSPDGQCLVVPSMDHNVCVWQLPTGRLLHAPLPHPDPVISLTFSPDGKTFLAGTGRLDPGSRYGEAQLWDTATARPLGSPWRHHGTVCVAFSPDGKTILVGSMDRTARLWDAATGKPLGPPLTHSGMVMAVAFSPDGKTFLTGTGDPSSRQGEVRLWDTATGKQHGSVLQPSSVVFAAAFSPDGKTICTGSGDFMSGRAQFWDVAGGKPLPLALEHQNNVRAVAFSPDGKTIATASQDRTVQLWDVATGKPRVPALQHQASVDAVQFRPDGKLLLTCSEDKTARLWSTTTGQPLGLPLRHPAGVLAGAFSLDGTVVLTGCEDRNVRLWDVAPAQGDVPELLSSLEVLTGMQLSREGIVQNLDAAAWQKCWEKTGATLPTASPLGLSWHQHEALRNLQAGQLPAALWHLDRQLQAHPDDWLAHVLRSKVHVEQEQLDRAAADWDKAMQGGPRESVVRWFGMYQAVCAEKEQWPTALWYLDRLAAAQPEDPALPLRRAAIHERLKQWQEAADAYGQALKVKADDPQLWRQQAQCYITLEQWDRAAAAFARMLDLLPLSTNQFAQRNVLCQELAGQEALFAKLIELRPHDGQLWIARARYHARRSQWKEAATHYAKAPEHRPVDDDAFEQACAYLLSGDPKGYEQFCRRLIARAGQAPGPFAAFVLARICGLTPHTVDDPARAVQWGEQALASGRTAWYLHALGMAHLRAGQLEQALQRFEEASKSSWNNGPAINALSLALVHHQLGHGEEAGRCLADAAGWIERRTPRTSQDPTSVPATDWMEMHVLQREAEKLLRKE